MAKHKGVRKLNLALQGGGVHGAFTWGVLDRLLQEPEFAVGWISAASAGAVNAVALVSGLATGGREHATATLAAVWAEVEKAGVPDLLRLNPFLTGLVKAAPLPNVAGLYSPYEFNPLGFDPLRTMLENQIDFDAVRRFEGVDLLISATDVSTGRARLFRRHEITVEVVLASACLPVVHHAVMIDGRAYWDGGFSANPDLVNLASQSPVGDTLLVQLDPADMGAAPRTAREITDRMNTIMFNQSLIRDIDAIIEAQSEPVSLFTPRWSRNRRLKTHRFHLIEAGRHTGRLNADSKVKPDHGLLVYLHGAGRTETHKWLERHGDDVGKRSSVDLRARYWRGHHLEAPGAPEPAVRALTEVG